MVGLTAWMSHPHRSISNYLRISFGSSAVCSVLRPELDEGRLAKVDLNLVALDHAQLGSS